MIRVDPDWWKTLFDEIYLVTDTRSVCDEALTCREVDFLEDVLKLEKSWPILDLCGGHGRHSLELSRRGFKDVTVLDYSQVLTNLGRAMAQKEGLDTVFIRNDAREAALSSGSFKAIIVMASSFGYFIDEAENQKILCEAFRLLKPEGSLFLDFPNKDYVLNHLIPHAWHEANEDLVVCRQRSVSQDIVYSRELVISKTKGLIRDAAYCTRLYSPETITAMLDSAGFFNIVAHKGYVSHEREGDYGLMTNRLLVTARKAVDPVRRG